MTYYNGFFINEPMGNNEFSYYERKNKSIYVPPLLEGDLNDVCIGDNIVFSEIEDNKEINAIGLKNIVKYKLGTKDIYIFDNHNHAFYFWIISLQNGKFNKGCKLVHIDQHKDMREPEDYTVDINDIKNVFRYTNYVLNVGNFIKPALYHNIFSDVVIIDSSYGFTIDVKDDYVLDIDLDIFSRDMDYIDYNIKINKIRNYINNTNVITIATSPFFINQNYAIKVLKDMFNYGII